VAAAVSTLAFVGVPCVRLNTTFSELLDADATNLTPVPALIRSSFALFDLE
jgi:hypothetical protein